MTRKWKILKTISTQIKQESSKIYWSQSLSLEITLKVNSSAFLMKYLRGQ